MADPTALQGDRPAPTPYVQCLGAATLDTVLRVPAIPPHGKVLADACAVFGAGMASAAAASIARLGGRSGIWEGRVNGVRKGALYKYHVVGANGHIVDKADPAPDTVDNALVELGELMTHALSGEPDAVANLREALDKVVKGMVHGHR